MDNTDMPKTLYKKDSTGELVIAVYLEKEDNYYGLWMRDDEILYQTACMPLQELLYKFTRDDQSIWKVASPPGSALLVTLPNSSEGAVF